MKGQGSKVPKMFEGPGLERAKRSFGRGRLTRPKFYLEGVGLAGFSLKGGVRWGTFLGVGLEGETFFECFTIKPLLALQCEASR